MILEIYQKNFALIKEIEVEAEFLPRTGEIIVAEEYSDDLRGMIYLLVRSVSHILKGDQMVAVVDCYASSSSEGTSSKNRNGMLREHGWIDTFK